jgi:hypothetical protein
MTFQRQVTVRINDVYNLVTNKQFYGVARFECISLFSNQSEVVSIEFFLLKRKLC